MNSPKSSAGAPLQWTSSGKSKTNRSSVNSCLRTPVDSKSVSRFSANKYTSPSPGVKETLGDRFIPVRACANLYERFLAEDMGAKAKALNLPSNSPLEPTEFNSVPEDAVEDTCEEAKGKKYSDLLKAHVLQGEAHDENQAADEDETDSGKNFLAFRTEYKCSSAAQRVLATSPITKVGLDFAAERVGPEARKLPQTANKILDAPGLKDDFYLNLVDWSSTDVLGVGLNNVLYTLRSHATKVETTLELPEGLEICSLSFNSKGTHMALGLSNGLVNLFDLQSNKLVSTFLGHCNKVTCASWCNDAVFSTGSRDRRILDWDIRAKNFSVRSHVGHKQEVCGIKWSNNERFLASGGNDNKVLLWTLQHDAPRVLSGHTAAVKAMAWSPSNASMLATGGGTADRTLKIWDAETERCVRSVDTGSQVCSLAFSKNTAEIVSTHGYSQNVVAVWKSGNLGRVGTLAGHACRVLYLALSPDGQTIVTGAGDETLRFWNIFPACVCDKSKQLSSLFPSCMDLR